MLFVAATTNAEDSSRSAFVKWPLLPILGLAEQDTPRYAIVRLKMWWLIPAFLGTAAQIVGTTLAGRGAPPDSPWPDDRGNRVGLHWEEKEWIQEYATRERYRVWGASLANGGVLLLLLAAIQATGSFSFFVTRWFTVLLLTSVAWSLGAAFWKTRSTNRWKATMIHEVSGGEGKGQKKDKVATHNSGTETTQKRPRVFVIAAVVVVVALAVFAYVWAENEADRENQEQTRLAQARYANTIVEGEHLGPVAIGETLQDVKDVMTHPFDSAWKSSDGTVGYTWWDSAGAWNIAFEPKGHTVVSVSYYASAVPIRTWAVVTTKGVRFGQDIDTVKTVYDAPVVEKCEESDRSLYYPGLGIAFDFSSNSGNSWNCKASPLPPGWLILDFPLKGITIYAPGYRPSWVKK